MPENQNLEDLHDEAMENWELVTEVDKEQRRLANEEAIFLAAEDGQWSEDARDKRRNRPMFTVDRISPVIDDITGNQRQTRTGIKVYPKKDGTKETADALTGIIRSIEQESTASEAYDNAFGEGLEGGYGGWQILYEWVEGSFDRQILIVPKYSAATSLYYDPADQSYTKEKGMWTFDIGYLSPKAYKKAYPDASITDFPRETYKQDWFSTERIRIANYWYKVKYKRKLGLMSNGTTLDLDDEKEVIDELAADGVSIEREREEDAFKVYMVVMNGLECLSKPQLWAGKYIPIIPYWGKRRIIDGNTYTWGKVRKAKDAQRISNYTISANVETVALAPKDPILYTATHVGNHKTDWKYYNTKNTPFLGFTPDPQVPQGPYRLGAPQVQTALIQQTQQAIEDVRASTGADAAMGQMAPDPRSGIALMRTEDKVDKGSFSYHDNLEKSKQYCGEQLIDLIQKVMDTEEQIQILGPNDKMEEIKINETVLDEESGKEVIVNDLALGQYGVITKTGPAAATQRQETVQQLNDFIGDDPEMKLLAGDIWLSNIDMNESDELTKRFRKRQIDQGIVEPSEEEKKELGLDQPPPPDPMQEALIRNVEQQSVSEEMRQAEMEANILNKNADTQKKILEGQKTTVDALKVIAEALKVKVELGLPIDADDADTAEGQQALVDQSQEEVLQLGELAGSMQLEPEAIPQQESAGPMTEGQPIDEQALFENRETPITPRPPTLAELSE